MVDEYTIETQLFNLGKIRSKLSVNRAPLSVKELISRYQEIYESITDSHIEAMNKINLEKHNNNF